MSMVLLVRHAAHGDVGKVLTGRTPGVRLGAKGEAQAERLGCRLRAERLAAVQTSPQPRAQETASTVARTCGLPAPQVVAALDEIDFGDWTGRTFAELDADPRFCRWNAERSRALTPAGDSMGHVQGRIMGHLEALAWPVAGADRCVALVSHADVIRAAVCHLQDIPLDGCWRLDIAPASITRIAAGARGLRLLGATEAIR